ncbi:MAG: valine--tRNA ligase [Archaeoglobaceae archaeon]|nr:valine--tRNA ligase [Archaeoglobaceae archaeon]MDW8118159.1 valine--tRNA ligase [Archaeoglobaceae archaeon]
MEKEYKAIEVEEKWLRSWDERIYYFDWNSKKPYYIIDTPPPYPTGSFHIGHALNWCIIDFIARYKRMNGYEVMFPQGWDCHGLPTEVKVEEKYGIKKSEVDREKFREFCVKFTEENILKMRATTKRLGFSIDWSKEYITMYPDYYTKTQVSFVRMFKKGLIYRGYHPVIICPRCETTIALAEIEYRKGKTKLNYIKFSDDVVIATTRPELIPACVALAVNPEDKRHSNLIGNFVKVPVGGHEVRVIADEAVDPSFGTGIVMICTFGDRQDVKWWKKYGLDLRNVINRDGTLNELGGKYCGLKLAEARERIIADLKTEGKVLRQEEVEHNVGVCWRCKTPVEIFPAEQWFVKVDKDKIIEMAKKVKWVPEFMFDRLLTWVEAMEWDWVISRQRVFATPIPVWYCKKCGKTMVAEESWLPVDPTKQKPLRNCECGSDEFEGERDVLDTWMDSSITPLVIAGWPELKDYPVSLRPQGHDIIRTWAFYTILRSQALENEIPWKEIVINGIVFGEDGRKMSKSIGNVISPEEVVEQYGADALRQWASSGVIGEDLIFSWREVVAASRFQQKLWSVARFALTHLLDYKESSEDVENLRIADKWILSKLNKLIALVRENMDRYRFDEALKAIRSFVWYELADNYIELVKGRLYTGEEANSAKFTLKYVLDRIIRLLAPITPFITEEIWSKFGNGSVHLQSYPEVDKRFIDEQAEIAGEEMKEILSAIRKLKHDKGMALNAPLKKIIVFTQLELDNLDLKFATNSEIEITREMPKAKEEVKRLKPRFAVLGPIFKEKVREIIKAVENLSDLEKLKLAKEPISVYIGSERIEVKPEWFELEIRRTVEGVEAERIETANSVVFVLC